jgi:hypothetical protein
MTCLHGGAVLIVTGTLTVTGAVLTDETATLVVGKDLRARHLYREGNLVVNGDATLRGAVYGFYEAGISRVKGTTRAARPHYAGLAKMLGLGTEEPADGNAAWGLKAFANVPRGEATDP